MRIENTQGFIDQLESLLTGGDIVINNIDPNKPQDRILVLQIALRKRSPQECALLIEDLCNAAEEEVNPERKKFLSNILVDTTNFLEIGLGLVRGGE